MRRSVKHALLTNVDAQLLQPSYSEAMALSPAGSGDVELSAAFTSASEQLKLTPNKSIRS
jgi:hypothetical protein